MKTFTAILMGLLFVVPALAQPDTLTILHVNDSHSNLLPLAPRNADLSGQRGGIARVASFVGYTRSIEPNVLFVHAGDVSIGDPMYAYYLGVPEYAILSQIGLDAMAVGNHEFDLTPVGLQMSLDTAATQGLSFPLLSANTILDDPSVSSLQSYITSNTVKTIGNMKVGIFGMTTPETMVLSLPAPAVIDTNLGVIAGTQVATLAAETCDVVIMLSHLGHALDRVIAENVPGIDIIIGGHDHELLTQADAVLNPGGDTTWIVQAGAFYEYVGRVHLEVDSASVRLLDYTPVPMTDTYAPEEPSVKALVGQMADDLESVYGIPFFSQQIATASEFQSELLTDLTSRREASTNVSRLVAKSFKAAIPCDLAITACGATAQPIQAGPIVPADLFRAIGYGFNETNGLGYRLASFTLSGLDLAKGLEFGLSTIEANDEFFIVGEHLLYFYDPGKPAYGRLDSVFIDNQPLDYGKNYTIVSSEFVLAVMRDFVAPQAGMTVLNDTVYATTEFEALYSYVVSHSPLTDVTEETSDGIVPGSFELGQNYPNPFNPSTSIRFTLPSEAIVQLTIFDVLGRNLGTLVSGTYAAGSHTVTWRPQAASGVYFYRLHVVNELGETLYTRVKRMVFMQ